MDILREENKGKRKSVTEKGKSYLRASENLENWNDNLIEQESDSVWYRCFIVLSMSHRLLVSL